MNDGYRAALGHIARQWDHRAVADKKQNIKGKP